MAKSKDKIVKNTDKYSKDNVLLALKTYVNDEIAKQNGTGNEQKGTTFVPDLDIACNNNGLLTHKIRLMGTVDDEVAETIGLIIQLNKIALKRRAISGYGNPTGALALLKRADEEEVVTISNAPVFIMNPEIQD